MDFTGFNFSKITAELDHILTFIRYFSVLVGIIFVITAAFSLVRHTKEKTSIGHLQFAIVSLFVGMLAINLNASIDTVTETLALSGGSSNFLDYESASKGLPPQTILMAIFIVEFIKVVGYVAFLRG